MLQRARGIPEIQVAQDGKVPVRIMKVGELRQGRLITGARLRKLPLAPLHQTELVVGCGMFWTQFQRLLQAGLSVVQVAGPRVRDAEIDVRGHHFGRPFGHLEQRGDTRLVPRFVQHAHRRLVVGAHPGRDAHRLRDREPTRIPLDLRLRDGRAHVTRLRHRCLGGLGGAADDESRREHHQNGDATHQRGLHGFTSVGAGSPEGCDTGCRYT